MAITQPKSFTTTVLKAILPCLKTGMFLAMLITKASIHDAKEAGELILSTRPEGHFILDDEDYIGERLNDALKIDGYIL